MNEKALTAFLASLAEQIQMAKFEQVATREERIAQLEAEYEPQRLRRRK